MKKDLLKNTGFIPEPLKEDDFRVGGISSIEYIVVNPSGDWLPYLPTNERQSNEKEDYMNCVSQSGDSSLEMQGNYLLATGQIPQGLINWLRFQGYIDKEGHLNLNDCAIAKMAGTTHQGLGLQAFWDCVRHNGLLPECDWHHTSDNLKWNDYYSEIPQALKDKAKQFCDKDNPRAFFTIEYEWVRHTEGVESDYTTISKHIKQAPMQIATATCPPWGSGVIQACGEAVNHATCVPKVTPALTFDYDSYPPFTKQLAANYKIPYMMKGVLKVKTFPLSTEIIRYAWLKRDDLKKVYPASNKFYNIYDSQNTIYDWAKNYLPYEMSELLEKELDWSSVDIDVYPEYKLIEIPEQLKKNKLIFICYSWLKKLLTF
jgi:hypothetical protein